MHFPRSLSPGFRETALVDMRNTFPHNSWPFPMIKGGYVMCFRIWCGTYCILEHIARSITFM